MPNRRSRKSGHEAAKGREATGPEVKGPDAPGAAQSNTVKDPADWTTGDEPMTGAQASYLKTLSEEAHEPFEQGLTKADASRRIDELQQKTGRGTSGRQG